jgi:aspartate/methionine/tyrosine aminotransferase
MTGLDWMPSRAQAMRYPDLIGVGGHPAVDMPAHVVEAAVDAARRPVYPPIPGTLALRAAIADRLGAELGRTIDPEREVLVTLGGMQGLYLAALAFGARTVSPAPAFFFRQVIEAAGGSCRLAYDWDEYAAAIDGSTTLAIVNTPVNPTGYVLRDRDLDAIAAALERSDALLLSDEAYAGILYDGRELLSPASRPDLAERTLVLRSFSKTFAMAAWRVGFAVGPPAVIDTLAKTFAWQSLAIDAVAQAAALAALTGPYDWIHAAVAELEEMRPRAVAAANATGVLRAELPEAAAFVWAAVERDEDAWSERLARDHRLPALAGRHFGAAGPSLRIPFGGRAEAREALLGELARIGHS